MENEPVFKVIGKAKYAADHYFKRTIKPETGPSIRGLNPDLLAAVQGALRDPGPKSKNIHHQVLESLDGSEEETELSWSRDTVIAARGGLIFKKWTVDYEAQDIHYACYGWLEQPGSILEAVSSTGRDAAILETVEAMPNFPGKETFSPFAQTLREHRKQIEPSSRVRGLFIFLRGIARVFLEDGTQYTVHLPFAIRKAWPLYPAGVMVQRYLSDEEKAEASDAEEPLPTLFSLSNPFAELRVVSVASSIKGGLSPIEDPTVPGPPPSITPSPIRNESSVPPGDQVIFCSESCVPEEQLFVTIDERGTRFTIWRYSHIVPDGSLPPPNFEKLSSPCPRGSVPPTEPSSASDLLRQIGGPSVPQDGPVPLASASTTLSSLEAEAKQNWSTTHERNDSGTRNELSATLDRMALGSQPPLPSFGAEPEPLRPAYWSEKLITEIIPPAE
jgi:anaphase-promoting complex subunit 1